VGSRKTNIKPTPFLPPFPSSTSLLQSSLQQVQLVHGGSSPQLCPPHTFFLLWHGSSTGSRGGNLCCPVEHLLFSSSSDLGAPSAASHYFFSLLISLCGIVSPSSHRVSPGHRHLGCGTGLCPVVGSLEPAGTGQVRHGAAQAASHMGRPTAPRRQRLGTCAHYISTVNPQSSFLHRLSNLPSEIVSATGAVEMSR